VARQYALPTQYHSSTSSLVITPDWLPSWQPRMQLWLSYRQAVGYDQVPRAYNDTVSVHLYEATLTASSGRVYDHLTIQLAAVQPASAWLHEDSQTVVRYVSPAGGSVAAVSVCRRLAAAESSWSACSDGLDNNCNGLADLEDPSCAVYVGIGVPDAVVRALGSEYTFFTGGYGALGPCERDQPW
jgi:hypothetical protein